MREDEFFNDPAWGDQAYSEGLKNMDIPKTWRGGAFEAYYQTYRGDTAPLQMTNGMQADGFRDVEGEPDMVLCNVYLRCMSWQNVKLPRAGFDGPKILAVPLETLPWHLKPLWWLAHITGPQFFAGLVAFLGGFWLVDWLWR